MPNLKALVLSGGRGTRLRPLTFTLAKQLIPLANKPVLGYVLDQVAETGINQTGIIIAPETGHYVKEYVKGGSEWRFNVTYIPQEPLGLAHAVKTAKNFLGEEDFIMCLGDNLQGQGLTTFVQKFKKEKMDALILLKAVENIQAAGGLQVGTYARAFMGAGSILTGSPVLFLSSLLAVPEIAVTVLRKYGQLKKIASEVIDKIVDKFKTGAKLDKTETEIIMDLANEDETTLKNLLK